jgi:L-threonylcarbamoyladenylate synthase
MKPVFADNDTIDEAATLLRQGGLVAFPTETVYGLGADASNPEAVRRIFAAKGRPANHPLIVHIADIAHIGKWAQNVPDAAQKLAEHFWPGPLALILNKTPQVPLTVTGGQHTVALRVPNHPVALRLLQTFGGGIAAPSANRFCRISPTLASHVAEELGDTVDLILDGGACQVGVESTIVDLSGDQPTLLRPGQIGSLEIETVLGCQLLISQHIDHRAPGMMAVHYAPATIAMLCPVDRFQGVIKQLTAQGKKVGILAYHHPIPENSQARIIEMPRQADQYAQTLYASLRELDNLKLDIILVEQPPDTALWLAVNNRLGKATLPC